MADKEVEVKPDAAIAPSVLEKFGNYVIDRAAVEAQIVAQELGTTQMEALLSATSEDELEAAMQMAGLIGLRDLDDGAEIQINEFHYAPGNRADYANRWGVFAVLECTLLATGQNVNIDTGVERVLVWLRVRELMGGYPVQRRVSKIVTGSGNEMITLLPLTKRVVNQ